MVACRGYHDWRRGGRDIPDMVRPFRQRMGHGRSDTLPLRHAMLIHRLYRLPRHQGAVDAQGAAAQLGPCRHLLAHCRFLFAHNAHCHATGGSLGVGALCFCMDGSNSGNGDEFRKAQGAQLSGDRLLRAHGAQRARSLQALVRQCAHRSSDMDSSRGRQLHHRSCLLQPTTQTIHAHRVPFLRPAGKHMPHHSRVGHTDGLSIEILMINNITTERQ